MREHLEQRDRVAPWKPGHEPGEVIRRAQLPLLLEEQDGGSGELLRERADEESGIGPVRNAELPARAPVAPIDDILSPVADQDRARELTVPDEGRQVCVEPLPRPTRAVI